MSNGRSDRSETLPERIMRIILDVRYGPLAIGQPASQSDDEGREDRVPAPNSTRVSRKVV